MFLTVLRAMFVLLMAAVGWRYINSDFWGEATWQTMAAAVTLAVLFVCVDILSSRRKLAVFSGVFFGLIVGISISYGLSFVVRLLVEQWMPVSLGPLISDEAKAAALTRREELIQFINMLVGMTVSYLSISFILQTKDDFRFIIPYVEFRKQTKGARPFLLDTSVLIDGRINDVAATGIFESPMIVPRFVVNELQNVADSGDRTKRARGKHGLDVLTKLQANDRTEVILYDSSGTDDRGTDVDQKLLTLAKQMEGRVITNDTNLVKVAQVRGVPVININHLASALKPVALPGEKMRVRLSKPGDQAGQGVGYLEDGTMVVVEQGRGFLNEEVEFVVTNSRQSQMGRMIFGRMGDGQPAPAGAPALPPAPPSRNRPKARAESEQSQT